MKNINKDLVIIGSNEYSETDGKCFFRSGLEIQMDHLSQFFNTCHHYSPKSDKVFDGYVFSDKVQVKAFSYKHHAGHKELLFRVKEYWNSIHRIYNNHRDAVFLVFIPDSYIGLIALQYLKRVKAKIVVRVTSDHMQEMKQRNKTLGRQILYLFVKPLYYIYMKKLLKNITQVYTGNKIYFNDKYSFSVNSSNLKQCDIMKREFPKQFTAKIQILYVGRFDPVKGLNVLLESLEHIQTDFILNIIGFDESNLTKAILNKIEHSPRSQNINFIGYVPYGEQLFSYYDSADIFVFPSLQDAQGKTFLEAMSRGVAVIATTVGSVPTIVQHEVNGYLIEPNSPQQIAEAINRLSKDKVLHQRLVENGYVTASHNTVDHVSETVLNAVKKILLNE